MGKTFKSSSHKNQTIAGVNSIKKENRKLNDSKSKSKITKRPNLTKKIKRRHKNKDKHASANFLNPVVAKAVNLKDNRVASSELIVQVPSNGDNNKSKKNMRFSKHIKENNSNKSSKEKTETQRTVGNQNRTQLPKPNKINNVGNKKGKKKIKLATNNKIGTLEVIAHQELEQKKDQTLSIVNVTSHNNSAQRDPINRKLDVKRLGEMLASKQKLIKKEKQSMKTESLRDRMMAKLRASRFRYLNETLYNNQSSESRNYFKNDPDSFTAYHDGYKQQVDQWPLNPLDVIISSIEKMPKTHIVADFGCGEARLASSVTHKVHSFDFVSLNDKVTACDMAHTPLLTSSVNVVVFCLSLMGANLSDYIIEANRVLKKDGILKIAEVESRFDQVEDFIKVLGEYGFGNIWRDLSHNLFYFLDFKKEKDITGKRSKLPPISLKSCLYKKR